MPDRRIVVDRFPAVDARQKRVHQHQLLRFGRELRRVRVGHHQPDVVADDHRLLSPQPLHEVVNADRRALHVEAVFGNIRAADPRQVRGDDGEALGDGATTWWLCDVPDEGALCRRGYDRGENDDERDTGNESDLRPLGYHLRSPCPTATRAAIHAVMSPMTSSLPMSLSESWNPPS